MLTEEKSVDGERLFDLNIEKILEAWEPAHAVRELIANALDEQTLTDTAGVKISRDSRGAWLIRVFGRGLRYEHFTQNESSEKLAQSGRVIGKFGVGLKDALATLDRSGATVKIDSAHGSITLLEKGKHGFDDVVTLHALVRASENPSLIGTRIAITGVSDDQMETAQGFFLKFSDEQILEDTPIGQIIARKDGRPARIYVAGLLVAEEENFAFSYNITSLTSAMRKALNRERTNVGRTAYTDRVKHLLLQAASSSVAQVLAAQLVELQAGSGADEVRWNEIAVHAVKILSANGRYLFVTADQLRANPDPIDQASGDGLTIITLPDVIHARVIGCKDQAGMPVRDLSQYQTEWNDSFSFSFLSSHDLTEQEREVLANKDSITSIVGGLPPHVEGVRISDTMRADFLTGVDALGLWDPDTKSIIIRRDQLGSLSKFAGTLLHEIVHARTGFPDVSRDFEGALTDVIGEAAARALRVNVSSVSPSRSLLQRVFGQ